MKLDDLIERYSGTNKEVDGRRYNEYLNFSREQLRSSHPADLAEINYELAQYALALQRSWNEHIAIRNWCDSTIKIVILSELEKSDIWAWEHKKAVAIQSNDYAAKLYKLHGLAQAEADKLYLLADRVKQVIYCIGKVIEVKLSQR